MKEAQQKKLSGAKELVLSIYRQGMKDNLFTAASSMVYSSLMALVPGFAFVYAFFGAFGVLQTFITHFSSWVEQIFGMETSRQFLNLLTTYTGNAMSLGVIGLLSFLYTMVLLINKVWTQVNRIYHASINRDMVRRIINFVSFLLLAVVLGAAYIAVQSKINSWYNKLLGIQAEGWSRVLGVITPHAINFVALFLITIAIPNVKVQAKAALYASLAGTIALLVTSYMFSSISNLATRYSIIYGSVATLFLFLFRMYIFWAITFWVVEFAYVYQFRPDQRKFSGLPQSPAVQLSEGINIMMLVGSNFKEGKGATATKEMVSRLAISEYRLYGYLDLLTDIGFVLPTTNNKSAYVVAKPLEDLKIQDMVTALYGLDMLAGDVYDTAGEAVAGQVKEHGVDSLGTLTIENMLQRV